MIIYLSLETIKYQRDTVVEGTARLIVWCPHVEVPMEMVVDAGDTVIIAQEGTLKMATKDSITPIGLDRKPLSKRLVYIMNRCFFLFLHQI